MLSMENMKEAQGLEDKREERFRGQQGRVDVPDVRASSPRLPFPPEAATALDLDS
jgi:hypothetical protein